MFKIPGTKMRTEVKTLASVLVLEVELKLSNKGQNGYLYSAILTSRITINAQNIESFLSASQLIYREACKPNIKNANAKKQTL